MVIRVGIATVCLGLASCSTGVEKQPDQETQQDIKLNAGDWYDRGQSFLESGVLDEAIESFTRAVELEPHFADAYNSRGIAWKRKGEFSLAIADFLKISKKSFWLQS